MNEAKIGQIETTETAADFDINKHLNEILRGDWKERLETESYEEVSESLDELKALREWRRETSRSQFSSFYQLFEAASALNRSGASETELGELRQTLVDRLIGQSRHLSPRVADLHQALLAEIEGSVYNFQFDSTSAKMQELKESGDLDLLFGGDIPYVVKANRLKTRLEGELLGRSALDRREKKAREKVEEAEQPVEQPQIPPPARDESKPGMDETERSKEGEMPPAIWTISPAYGGYYKEQSFDAWDLRTNTWRQSEYLLEEMDNTDLQFFDQNRPKIGLQAMLVHGRPVRLPLPYTFDLVGARREELPYLIEKDQNGDYVITLKRNHQQSLVVDIVMQETDAWERGNLASKDSPIQSRFELQNLSRETLERLQEIHKTKKGNLAKARAIAGWTMRRLKYSNDSSFNQIYDSAPSGYIAAIDEHKQADCDVANTYFAALCSALNIPVRHTVGHMVKGRDDKGNSRITSGTGHAWSEVWDETENKWVRIDATPAGDPQLEEQHKNDGSIPPPGDYGEQEAIGPTDEELAKLEEELSELTEKLSYTQTERELAEAAGVEPSEARQIVKEINEAENTRLPGGKRVVDLLSQLFSLIVEARKTIVPDYTGPLRKREGGEEIEDIVAHKIGIKAGESDPKSRQKEYARTIIEQIFNVLDVYIGGDKSGSMSQAVDGEAKWRIQRRVEYLIFSSLYRFDQNLQRAGLHSTEVLSVRSEGLSFRDSDMIDVDKPLSSEFSAADKVRLWQSLGNQGLGNGDIALLSHLRDQIKTEREELVKQGKTDNRLRVVVVCSDGYPNNPAGVHRLARELAEMNTVVVGVGLTETAASIPIIFNIKDEQGKQIARGDIAKDINDLPAIVAKHIITEAIRLFPEKSKKSAERIIAAILDKFNNIK